MTSVSRVNRNVATIVGQAETVLRTTDGGDTWVPQTLPGGTGYTWLQAVHFINENTGTLVGQEDAIYRTDDGGQTWRRQFSPVRSGYSSVYFSSPSTGTILGSVVLRTTDGGNTWVRQVVDGESTGLSVSFADDDHGTIVWGLRILRTNTGGFDLPFVESLRDPFSANAIDLERWNASATEGSASESGGSLNLAPDPNTGSSRMLVTSNGDYSLYSSQAAVEVPRIVSAVGNVNNTFSLQLDSNNRLVWWYENGVLYGLYYVAGARFDVARVSYSPTLHRWWRIRQANDNVYWETSPDGADWTQQGTAPASRLFSGRTLKVMLGAATWGDGSPQPGQARYANLNVR